MFATKGYEAATVSEIVAGAGVAQGTFYIYFPGKESLAGAFAEALADRFAEVAEDKAGRCRTFDSGLARALDAAYEVADEYRDVFLIANRGLELADDLDEWMNRTAASRGWLEDFIRHWQKQGAVDPKAHPVITARVLRDAFDRAAKSYVLYGDRHYGRDLIELLRRGLTANRAR